MSMVTKTFVDANGKRHYARGKTLEEAIVNRERMKAEYAKHAPSSSMLFKKWTQTALDTYKPNVSPRYLSCMKSRLNAHILPYIGDYAIGKIQPIQCQMILNNVSDMSKSHIKKIAQELSFYFDAARKNNLITKNPCDDITRPKGYQNKRRSITKEERASFENVCAKFPGKFTVFQLMLYCGCRPAEACEVKYEDVKDIDGVHYLHVRGTKTANSDRFVPIRKEVRPLLMSSSTGYVALSEDGNKIKETAYRRLTQRLKRELDIDMGANVYRNQIVESVLDPSFVPYFFRHTFCTDLKKQGVDIRLAKNLMGHADIKTTANIYDHDDGETLRLAAEQMGLLTETKSNSSQIIMSKNV